MATYSIDQLDSLPSAGLKPFEQWADLKKTPLWLLNGTKLSAGWAVGREVTEQDYDAAVERAANAKMNPA